METNTTFNNFLGGKTTHASLFSGIGGFDLAASNMNWENVFQVEIDKFCNKVLELRFPKTEKFTDIKTFDGTKFKNKIDVLTGGFPCQPFSVAGKRKGNEDERALWYEMYRVIKQVEPTYIVAENVPGLLTIESGMVFEQVCLDLENAGYEVQPFIIPAASLNAPHKRDRVWIIAYSDKFRERARRREVSRENEEISQWNEDAEFINSIKFISTDTRRKRQTEYEIKTTRFEQSNKNDKNTEQVRCGSEIGEEESNIGQFGKFSSGNDARVSNEDNVRNTKDTRQSSSFNRQRERKYGRTSTSIPEWERNWYEVATEFCRVDDGISNRVDRLKSLGNAIVPQVAFEIFNGIEFCIKDRQKLLKVETDVSK